MTLAIAPGPMPDDGTRIKIEPTMRAFVQGAVITGFSVEQFTGSQVTFVFSSTEPPPLVQRTRGFRWFKRGEGVTYQWDIYAESGVTYTNWRAIAGRKEIVCWLEHPASKGDLVWVTTRVGQHLRYRYRQIENQRYVLEVASTGATGRWHPKPPFFVCTTGSTGGQFQIFTETGLATINCLTSVTGPALACHGGSEFDWRLMQFSNPYTFTNSVIASVVQSGPTGATNVRAYLWPNSSHLLKT